MSGRLQDEDVEKAARLGFTRVPQGHSDFKIFKSFKGKKIPRFAGGSPALWQRFQSNGSGQLRGLHLLKKNPSKYRRSSFYTHVTTHVGYLGQHRLHHRRFTDCLDEHPLQGQEIEWSKARLHSTKLGGSGRCQEEMQVMALNSGLS